MLSQLVNTSVAFLLSFAFCTQANAFPDRLFAKSFSQERSDSLYAIITSEIATHREQPDYALDLLNQTFKKNPSVELAELIWHTSLQTQNNTKIIASARQWVAIAPQDITPHQSLLSYALESGDEASFVKELSVMYQLTEDKSGWVARITAMLAQAKLTSPQILTAITPYWEKEAKNPKVQLAIGLFHKANNNVANACRSGMKAIKLANGDEQIITATADLCWNHDRTQAINILSNYLINHPNAYKTRLVYSRALAKSGQLKKALSELELVTQQAPDDPVAFLNAGEIANECQNFEKAEKFFSRYLDLVATQTPDADLSDNDIWLRLAAIYHQNGHHEDEVEALASLTTGPNALQARIKQAFALAEIKQLPEARSVLQKARQQFPDNLNLLLTTEAQLLIEAERGNDALNLLNEARQAAPNDQDLIYDTAIIAQNLGQSELAEKLLQSILDKDPDHIQANNALAYLWVTQDRHLKEARRRLEHAYRLAPLDPYVLDSMGWLCFKEKRYDQATEFTLTSLKKQFDVEVACHLIEILATSGRHDEAIKLLKELSQRIGSDPRISELAQRLNLAIP